MPRALHDGELRQEGPEKRRPEHESVREDKGQWHYASPPGRPHVSGRQLISVQPRPASFEADGQVAWSTRRSSRAFQIRLEGFEPLPHFPPEKNRRDGAGDRAEPPRPGGEIEPVRD